MKLSLFLVCFFAGAVVSPASTPRSLDEQLAVDNPKVIAYLKSLPPGMKNRKVAGIRLSDGSEEMKGDLYLGSRYLSSKKQHMFLFKGEGEYRAYVWVEKGGSKLVIPRDKKASAGENAYVLSGDIFTFTKVGPQDGLVILSGADPEWLEKQGDMPGEERSAKASWVFAKAGIAAPKGSLLLKVNGTTYTVVKKAEALYQELGRDEFKDYSVPKEALLACYSWNAGFGDVIYVVAKEKALEIYRREMDESENSRYPLKRILTIVP